MDKLTLRIDYSDFIDNDFINYLSLLDGIKLTKIDNKNNEIYVEYDSLIISLKILKKEILLYLNISKIPSIISFDKHNNDNLNKDIIVIKDLCCEYCLKGMIDELLEIEGINSAYSDFDYINKKDVNIFITYNEKIVNKNKIIKLEQQFNNIKKDEKKLLESNKKAGCFLIRRETKEIALIYREKYNDYSFPKGHVEKGESLKEAATRETAEETKRNAKIIDIYKPFVERYTTSKGENCTCYMFFALDKGKSNNKCEDTHDVIWTKLDKVEDTLSYISLKNTWNSVKHIIVEILNENN